MPSLADTAPTTAPTTTRRRAAAAAGALTLAAAATLGTAAPAAAETEVPRPDRFTSAFTVMATPDQVIDPDGNPVDGAPGATGTFNFMINSDEEIICYDITVTGAEPPYESAAKTATHVHEANRGEGGPPRLAFPDPQGPGDVRTSSGCLQGPFTTGLEGDDGSDTGEGFTLAQIEANPAGFSADTHTSEFVAGAVRGQLTPMPVGGVATGAGGLAAGDERGGTATTLAAGATAAGFAAVGGILVLRRRTHGARG